MSSPPCPASPSETPDFAPARESSHAPAFQSANQTARVPVPSETVLPLPAGNLGPPQCKTEIAIHNVEPDNRPANIPPPIPRESRDKTLPECGRARSPQT